jgi:hypothetical protein
MGGPLAAVAWSELTPTAEGPSAREDHTWTVAGDGRTAYLFGGRSGGQEFDDLWAYDLASDSWMLVELTGDSAVRPAARFGHVAVWVDGVGLVVWSGQAGTRFFADVWAFDPDSGGWQELASNGDVPPARYGSCAGLGPDGRLWISHGFTEDSGRFSDTRAYDFATGSWTDMTPAGSRPVERCLHDCLWTPDGRLLIYAGQTTGAPAIGDLWTYDVGEEAWSQGPQPEPEARQLYALAAVGETAFVFGGNGSNGNALEDLWQLELGSLSWTEAQPDGPLPAGRAASTLIADPERDRLLLFGGKAGNGELADLWQLEVATSG